MVVGPRPGEDPSDTVNGWALIEENMQNVEWRPHAGGSAAAVLAERTPGGHWVARVVRTGEFGQRDSQDISHKFPDRVDAVEAAEKWMRMHEPGDAVRRWW